MATYLITYDLSDASREDELLKYIKGTGNWARASKSSYAVESNKTAEQVVADIRRITADKLVVYVFTVKRPYFGFGPAEANEWLEGKLTF